MLTSVFSITSLLIKKNHKSEEEGLRHIALRKVHSAGSKFNTNLKLFANYIPKSLYLKMTLGKSNVFLKFGEVWTDLHNRKDLLFGLFAFFKYRLMAALIEVGIACFVKQLYCFVA